MRTIIRKALLTMAFISTSLLCISCGKNSGTVDNTNYYYNSLNDKDESSESQATETSQQEIYLIVEINSAKETMRVYRYENSLEYQYYYGLTTEFCNKYGDHTSLGNFSVGDVIYIDGVDSQGKVTRITKADSVWVYDDVTKFSIDEENKSISVGDTEYEIKDDTYIFAQDAQTELSSITGDDELSLVGIGNSLLSVNVTSGHGILQLANTDLFEGSYLQLNSNIFVEITKDMTMNLAQGDYTLVVANDGWGGSKDITITEGETTTVDLDEIKGDGPKSSNILFQVDVAGAQVYLDGSLIDYSAPVTVTYGAHKLEVIAEGYSTWSRTLYVNSEEATIVISLNDTSDDSSETTTDDSSTSTDTGSTDTTTSTDSSTGTTDSDSSTSSDSTDDLEDYLSTLSELLSSIY